MTIIEPVLSSSSRSKDIVMKHSGAGANACSYGSSREMGVFKEKENEAFHEKLEANEHHNEQEVHDYTPQINEFQHIAKPQTICVQDAFKPGPENYCARTDPSIRRQMSKQGVDIALNCRTTLESSKEFNEKFNCNAPCLAIVSSFQDPALTKDAFFTNINLASTSRTGKGIWPMNFARRMNSKKMGVCSEMNKGKEPIIEADDSKSSSNMRDNGLKNFDCISSRGIVSTIKRARYFNLESEKLICGKRLKKQSNDNCSFMNWVTTLTNGLTKPSKDAPMEFFQHPSLHVNRIISSLAISEKEREVVGVSHGIKGFKSIFQNMCRHGYNVSRGVNKCIDHQKKHLDTAMITEKEKQDGCAELMSQSGLIIQKNLWITPYMQNVSSAGIMSEQYSENRCAFLEDITNRCSEKPQHCSVSRSNKLEPKLQHTRSEPVSSTFVKRLESLMHTSTLNNVDAQTGPNKICLFCGMTDHSIRECSKVVKIKLDHLLKAMPSYDRNKEASCFCIRCFHLDHWAVACSNISAIGNQAVCNATGFGDVDFRNTSEKHQNDHFANLNGAVMLLSDSTKFFHGVDNKAADSDFVVSTNVSLHKNDSACCGALDLHVNQDDDASNTDRMKVTASFYSQNEVKMSELAPFCSHLSNKVASEPEGIFIFVRKLRLSRKDIIRWMKSPAPHIDLTGFFLRLRIGKLEKGLGGTGYHVANINGAASYQSSIIACVGSSTFSVTSHFVSNQDFDEDELNTWWFQKLRDGIKIPSTGELNEKLQLRKKLGF